MSLTASLAIKKNGMFRKKARSPLYYKRIAELCAELHVLPWWLRQ